MAFFEVCGAGETFAFQREPIPNAIVCINDKENQTTLNGKFIIEGLSAGIHFVSVKFGGSVYERLDQIHLRRGGELSVNIHIPKHIHQVDLNPSQILEEPPDELEAVKTERKEILSPEAEVEACENEVQSFIYPVKNAPDKDWVRTMIEAWSASKRPFLCFPFARFFPRQLANSVQSDESFWLYMYDTSMSEGIPYKYGRQVRFRFQVVKWNQEVVQGENIFVQRFPQHLKETIWFLCEQVQEIRKESGEPLTIDDFEHIEGKKLYSTLRTTIPPARLCSKIAVARKFP